MNAIFHRLRAAGLVLALAAITFKAFLPPGFMLDAADGRIAVVLCQVGGETELSFDPLTGAYDEPDAPHKADAAPQCPYALLGAPALASVNPSIAEPVWIVAIDATAHPLAERPQTLAAGPPLPARGPPLNA
jgi:hypothetical protein